MEKADKIWIFTNRRQDPLEANPLFEAAGSTSNCDVGFCHPADTQTSGEVVVAEFLRQLFVP